MYVCSLFKKMFEKVVRSMDDDVDGMYVEVQVLWYHLQETDFSFALSKIS